MNICKERINSRTKSLREKFSRNRSYSELSFKDIPKSTSTSTTKLQSKDFIASTTTTVSNSIKNKFNLLSKKSTISNGTSAISSSTGTTTIAAVAPTIATEAPIIEYQQLQNESYGSALELNVDNIVNDSSIIDLTSSIDNTVNPFNQQRSSFLWQHDVAVQCELLPTPQSASSSNVIKSSNKKNLSISHSATTTLINVAAAKLRNITDYHSYGCGLDQSTALIEPATLKPENALTIDSNQNGNSAGGNVAGRFWRSTLSVTFNTQNNTSASNQLSSSTNPISTIVTFNDKKPSSFLWSSSSVRRRPQKLSTPILKRASSFNDKTNNGQYYRLVQSSSSPSSPELMHEDNNNNSDNDVKINKDQSVLPTVKSLSFLSTNHTKNEMINYKMCNVNNKKKISSAPDSFDNSMDEDDEDVDTDTNIMILSSTSEIQDNKNNQSSNNNSKVNTQKKQIKRKNDFERKSNLSKYNYDNREQICTDDDNELYNFDTKNRLLNISLDASNQNEQKLVMKQFLLDLPASGSNKMMMDNASNLYLNLPSPNVQSETQEVNPVLRKLSVLSKQPDIILKHQQQLQKNQHDKSQKQSSNIASNIDNPIGKKFKKFSKCDMNLDDDYLLYNYYYDDTELMAPDEQPSIEELKKRRRRRALVPPKLITDGPSIDDEDNDDHVDNDKNSGDNVNDGIATKDNEENSNNITFANKKDESNDSQIDCVDSNIVEMKINSGSRNSLPIFNVEITESHESAKLTENLMTSSNVDDVVNRSKTEVSNYEQNKQKISIIKNDNQAEQDMDNDNDDRSKSPRSECDQSSQQSSSSSNLLGHNLNNSSNNNKNRRRSSMVVIPPMQICPGDLLVYSKVLTQRANMIAESGGLASSFLNDHDNRKSHKNTWSLLRLFDRSGSRSKADQILCGLEEFLSNLTPSNSFFDETMLRYRGISWYEFQSRLEKQRRSSNDSSSMTMTASVASMIDATAINQNQQQQQHHSKFIDNSRHSSLQSNALETIAVDCPLCHRVQNVPIPAIIQSSPSSSPIAQHQQCQPILNQQLQKIQSYSVDRLLLQQQQQQQNDLTTNKHEIQSAKHYQRTDSVSTEQEVESIVDFEIADVDEKQPPPLQSTPPQSQQSQLINKIINNNDIYGPGPAPEPSQFCRDCFQHYKREKRRREALWELFQSELLFLTDHLMVLKNVFMEPLKSIQVEGYAMFAEPEVLFGNLDELCLVTYAFCKEFLNLLIQQQQEQQSGDHAGIQVADILNKLYLKNNTRTLSSAQAYHRYTLNYINALQYLETLRRQLEFIEFEKWCNRDPRCKKLQLTDLLVTPVQHVMRVPLLLKEIESKTYLQDEKQIIHSIIEQQEHSLRELDDKMRWLKNFERLLEIQRNILWPSIFDMDPKIFVPEFLKSFLQKQPCEKLIVSPRRQIILEGPLMVLDSGKAVEMYVFLFDDLLLITRRKKGLGKKQSTLTERWVSNCSGRTSSYSSVGTTTGPTAVSNPSGTVITTNNASISGTNVGAISVPGTGSLSTTVANTIVTSASIGGHHATSASLVGAIHHGSLPGHHLITTTATTATASAGSITQTGINLVSLHGEPHHGPLTGGTASISGASGNTTSGGNAACFKYVVYKQPLSLDRFYIHDIPGSDATGSSGYGGISSSNSSNLKNSFVLVCLNRFQQVIAVHTFQATSESAKHTWLSKLRSTCDRWKRTVQSNNVIRAQQQHQQRQKSQPSDHKNMNRQSSGGSKCKTKIDSETKQWQSTTVNATILPKNKRITEMQNNHDHNEQIKNQQHSLIDCDNDNDNNKNQLYDENNLFMDKNIKQQRLSVDSANSVEASISYQIDDSQLTATTYT